MNRPELKSYVDKVCMDFATIMIDHCEQASKDAKEQQKELRFEDIEEKVRISMNDIGASLALKVQEIAKTYGTPTDKPKMPLKINVR
jgi:hypothetical protein